MHKYRLLTKISYALILNYRQAVGMTICACDLNVWRGGGLAEM